MTADLTRVLRVAGSLWRRDLAILLPLTGLFVFVPQYAVLLLVPAIPPMAAEGAPEVAMTAWGDAVAAWMAANGALYIVCTLVAQFGALVVATLYLGSGSGQAGTALQRALVLVLRYVLATILVGMPMGSLALLALPIGPAGMVLALVPILYLLGRTLLVGPVLAAEPATGAVQAILRSWALTRGSGAKLAVLVAAIMIPGQLVGAMIIAADRSMKAGGLGNPVALAIIDAGAAAAAWAAAVALALSGVAVYRGIAVAR